MKEREINLIDLCVEILLHWRVFIVCMLLGGVLAGAWSSIFPSEKMMEIDFTSPENYLSEQSIQNVNWTVAYETACLTLEDYLENSALMKINPNQVSKAEATIAIKAETPQKSCNIEKAYEDVTQSGELMMRIMKDVNTELIGVEELILLEGRKNGNLSGDATNSAAAITTTIGEGINTFRIVVKYGDEAQCKKILETVLAFLKEKQPGIESAFGKHEVVIANTSFAVVYDIEVAEIQKKNLENRAVMIKTFSDAKSQLSDKEQQYYDFLMNEKEAAPIFGISRMYVFVGMALAALLYVFLFFLVYIFNTKIRVTDSLQELYNIPQLGMIPVGKGGKKPFGFIDGKILSLRNRNKRQFTSEEALEFVSVAIKISAGKEALNEVFLIGCGLKGRSLEACEKIKAHLEKDGIQIKILSNVLYDAGAMEELESAKGVVLVESVGVTLYHEIAEELELLKRQRITMLGGILVE